MSGHWISILPYEYLTPLQAAVGVVQKGLRPTIPKNTHSKLAELLEKCWQQDPANRPDFSEILEILQLIAKEVPCQRLALFPFKFLAGPYRRFPVNCFELLNRSGMNPMTVGRKSHQVGFFRFSGVATKSICSGITVELYSEIN
ncbi:hypothetical protein BHE74_00034763 [Ensete ventricosum]|nr:hypothetical protein BHE74_00034763 [Ensete ventricosum]